MKYNGLKKLSKRIHLWYFLFLVLILADEYIKEGYIVSIDDFLKPLTHENLLFLATLTYIILNVLNYIRGKHDRNNS